MHRSVIQTTFTTWKDTPAGNCLMFDVFHGTALVYRTDLCSRCSDQRLRSSASGKFVMRRTRKRFADSSFTVAGPAACNSLPVHIDSHSPFCRHLKLACLMFLTDLNCITHLHLFYFALISFIISLLWWQRSYDDDDDDDDDAYYPRRLCRSAWVERSSPSVCLFVCLFVRSITQKRMIPKCSNLV